MLKILYVTSSSFSGSTFLSFLLNTHPDIATTGETEGWRDADVDTFKCSCGQVLKSCPFFKSIADVFRQNGMPFAYNNFGTSYRLADSTRFNQYLTGALPFIRNSSVERLRDGIVTHLPGFSGRIAQSNRANVLFMRTALSLAGATVFLDIDKNPYRLRYLRRLEDVDLRVLYLIRDPRGVVLTFMENRGWDAATATRVWIREQLDILRIMKEFPSSHRIYYEDLCEDVNTVLAGIHRYLELRALPFSGDFRGTEHHILGNSMRLENVGKIVKSERWKTKLSVDDQAVVARIVRAYIERHRGDPLAEILGRYMPESRP